MNQKLRQLLCRQPVVDSEGNINHAYFADIPGSHWSRSDQDQLVKGLQKLGVGNFTLIQKSFLPKKHVIEIRLRTCLLLSIHDLSEFEGLKDLVKFEEIKSKNIAAGKKSGKLKYGVYLNK